MTLSDKIEQATTPSADDARDAVIEECAKVAQERVDAYAKIPAPNLLNAARSGEAQRIADNIRALKGTGHE